mmetsp:Transcript_8592/g.21225  ORF Transcript_8592/g.21225 Transcript_8592/m.21225 type:complete len:240 (+) Transcript_8592:677-1396(+)
MQAVTCGVRHRSHLRKRGALSRAACTGEGAVRHYDRAVHTVPPARAGHARGLRSIRSRRRGGPRFETGSHRAPRTQTWHRGRVCAQYPEPHILREQRNALRLIELAQAHREPHSRRAVSSQVLEGGGRRRVAATGRLPPTRSGRLLCHCVLCVAQLGRVAVGGVKRRGVGARERTPHLVWVPERVRGCVGSIRGVSRVVRRGWWARGGGPWRRVRSTGTTGLCSGRRLTSAGTTLPVIA